jgi:hypothetical protein
VPEPRGYGLSYSDDAVEAITAFARRRQRLALDRARAIARYPATRSDYVIRDPAGRDHHHIFVDGFVFAYLVDHADKMVTIIEITDVRDAAL